MAQVRRQQRAPWSSLQLLYIVPALYLQLLYIVPALYLQLLYIVPALYLQLLYIGIHRDDQRGRPRINTNF